MQAALPYCCFGQSAAEEQERSRMSRRKFATNLQREWFVPALGEVPEDPKTNEQVCPRSTFLIEQESTRTNLDSLPSLSFLLPTSFYCSPSTLLHLRS